mmetsp:Transcript_101608/g.196525  ORF Transcript_101608/g.196525 Transcript_101608/m.196525 type:complete len:128 (+) Transcript_101608:1126-1509(+)
MLHVLLVRDPRLQRTTQDALASVRPSKFLGGHPGSRSLFGARGVQDHETEVRRAANDFLRRRRKYVGGLKVCHGTFLECMQSACLRQDVQGSCSLMPNRNGRWLLVSDPALLGFHFVCLMRCVEREA